MRSGVKLVWEMIEFIIYMICMMSGFGIVFGILPMPEQPVRTRWAAPSNSDLAKMTTAELHKTIEEGHFASLQSELDQLRWVNDCTNRKLFYFWLFFVWIPPYISLRRAVFRRFRRRLGRKIEPPAPASDAISAKSPSSFPAN